MLFFWTFWAFNQIFFWQNDRKWPGNTQLASLCKHQHQICYFLCFSRKTCYEDIPWLHGQHEWIDGDLSYVWWISTYQFMHKNKTHLGLSMQWDFSLQPTCTYILASMPINGTWVTWTTHQIWRIILNFQTVVVWLQIRFFIWSLHFDLSLS